MVGHLRRAPPQLRPGGHAGSRRAPGHGGAVVRRRRRWRAPPRRARRGPRCGRSPRVHGRTEPVRGRGRHPRRELPGGGAGASAVELSGDGPRGTPARPQSRQRPASGAPRGGRRVLGAQRVLHRQRRGTHRGVPLTDLRAPRRASVRSFGRGGDGRRKALRAGRTLHGRRHRLPGDLLRGRAPIAGTGRGDRVLWDHGHRGGALAPRQQRRARGSLLARGAVAWRAERASGRHSGRRPRAPAPLRARLRGAPCRDGGPHARGSAMAGRSA